LYYFFNQSLDFTILFACIISFYQLFYSWWTTWNNINDRIHFLLPTQTFFTLTELIPAICLAHLVDKKGLVKYQLLLCANVIAMSHIYLALEDQGFEHLFLQRNSRKGTSTRDFFLLLGDLITIVTISSRIESRKGAFWNYLCGIIFLKFNYWIIKRTYGYS